MNTAGLSSSTIMSRLTSPSISSPYNSTLTPFARSVLKRQLSLKKQQRNEIYRTYHTYKELAEKTLSANSDYKNIMRDKEKIDKFSTKIPIIAQDDATTIVFYVRSIVKSTTNLVNNTITNKIRILNNNKNSTKDALTSVIAVARMALYTADNIIHNTINSIATDESYKTIPYYQHQLRYFNLAILELNTILENIENIENGLVDMNTSKWLFSHGSLPNRGGKRKTMKRKRLVKTYKTQ